MHLQIVRTLAEFDQLHTEWNDLLTCCSASHVPFLRHEYLRTWWASLGGGEWTWGELFIVIARQDDGELLGIAPLFFSHNHQEEPALLILGSIEISDYLDLIVRTSEIPAFLDALLTLLQGDQAPAWQVLDWYNLPEASPTLPALQSAAEKHGWSYQQERLQACPYIALPGDWEAYLASIDKKQRHEIRRKLRRAEEYPAPVRWYIVQDGNNLQAEMEAFFALMVLDPEKERFLTPAMRRQMLSAAHAAFQEGWLQLSVLEVAGEKAASYLSFDYAGHLWIYNSGLNFAFRELSPGWVLLARLIQWANENQRLALDFMRGDEDYKYRFGGTNRYVVHTSVRR